MALYKPLRSSKRIGRIEREILEELSLSDLAYGFLLSARSTKRMRQLAGQRAKDRYRRKLAIERLRKCGFISGAGTLSITRVGANTLESLIKQNIELISKKDWDHKWRIVAFDIPERLAAWRDIVRKILKRAGFVQLQRSIWIFPYECQELVQLIKTESKLSKHILYGVLDRIEEDAQFKKIFKL